MNSDTHGVDDEIERLKRTVGVELDRDLATLLGIDASAVAAWRRRGKVPEKYSLLIGRYADRSAEEGLPLSFGVGLREAYIFALIRLAALRLGEDIWGRGEYDAIWAGFRLSNLYEALDRAFDRTKDEYWWREKYEGFRLNIEQADLPVWLETIQRR